ncbi:SET domain-containing protein [Trametes cingulata]|nr:SET domain-containing protein [Trametes cingulata]
MADLDRQRWERLLRWLNQEHGMDTNSLRLEAREAPGAGRGLFATKDIPPSSTLFKIPGAALMNVSTVLPLYPQIKQGRLSGIQLVSLHLLLHKPSGDDDSLDGVFGPYISTLPRDFSSHPLTWLVNRRLGKEDHCGSYFLDRVPPSTQRSVTAICDRFWKDWEAVAKIMSSRRELKMAKHLPDTQDLLPDFLWAWLNVNTRCIYYRIRQNKADPDNFTLCPILDFANHGSGRTHIFPVISADIWGLTEDSGQGNRRRRRTDSYTFLGPSGYSLSAGDELLLKYGAHSNRFLFTEYGFVNPLKDVTSSSEYSGEVDVQDLVEDLIRQAGSVGPIIKSTLEEAGYWGDWTLHKSSSSANASWRLIAALRLICALERFSGEATLQTHFAIEAWTDVTNGVKDKISLTNEESTRSKLLQLCKTVRARALKNDVSASITARIPQNRPGWFAWMSENIRILWREELEVAEAVMASIQAGEEL